MSRIRGLHLALPIIVTCRCSPLLDGAVRVSITNSPWVCMVNVSALGGDFSTIQRLLHSFNFSVSIHSSVMVL